MYAHSLPHMNYYQIIKKRILLQQHKLSHPLNMAQIMELSLVLNQGHGIRGYVDMEKFFVDLGC